MNTQNQQMPARPDAASRLTQQTVRRQAEIQAMLQQHHIGGVLTQGPGLLLTDDLHARHRRAKAHVVLDLPRLGWAFGARAVAHQITTEKARQLFFQQAPLFLQQQLAERPGKPVARLADEFEPLRVGLGECLISHRCLRMTGSACPV